MPDSLPEDLAEHLKRLGDEIDIGRQPTVFDGGLVGTSDATESGVRKDVAGQEAGSKSGPRTGRRARARPRTRPRGAQASGYPFRSDALEDAYGTEFRILAQHYEALGFEDKNGLWVAVASHPLGTRGPEVHLLVALPIDERVAPRAWAFRKIGRQVELMSLKHTNFPDASICAYPHGHVPWPNPNGLLGLIDIYVLWAVRKLHRDHFGWWPGPQVGACPFYRLREFDAREDCGCGSGKRYGECHMPLDAVANQQKAAAEFRSLFGCNFDDRAAPENVIAFARSKWESAPSMASVFACRKDPSGVQMI